MFNLDFQLFSLESQNLSFIFSFSLPSHNKGSLVHIKIFPSFSWVPVSLTVYSTSTTILGSHVIVQPNDLLVSHLSDIPPSFNLDQTLAPSVILSKPLQSCLFCNSFEIHIHIFPPLYPPTAISCSPLIHLVPSCRAISPLVEPANLYGPKSPL